MSSAARVTPNIWRAVSGSLCALSTMRVQASGRRVLTHWLLFNSLEGLGMILLWCLNSYSEETQFCYRKESSNSISIIYRPINLLSMLLY